jgi:hypothetical protein
MCAAWAVLTETACAPSSNVSRQAANRFIPRSLADNRRSLAQEHMFPEVQVLPIGQCSAVPARWLPLPVQKRGLPAPMQ